MNETQRERQELREAESRTDGILRYNKRLSTRDVMDTKPGKALIMSRPANQKNVIELLGDALQDLVDRTEAGQAGSGRPAFVTSYLRQLDVHVVAYLTTRVVLRAAIRGEKLTLTAMRLAKAIEDTYLFDQLMEAEPALGRSAQLKAEKWTTGQHRVSIMRGAADLASVKGLTWSKGDKVKLGAGLINKFCDVWQVRDRDTGEVRPQITVVTQHTTGKHEVNVLVAAPGITQWLEDAHLSQAITEPKFQPMLIPPIDWTSINEGGFLTQACRQPFVRELANELRDDLMSVNMSEVFRAVNNAQATPWAINTQVLGVIKEAWSTRSQLGGMPPADDLPIPASPDDIPRDLRVEDMNDDQIMRFKAWRVAAAKAHEVNAQIIGKRFSLLAQMGMADDLRNEERFYFPHNVDFRGRIYSIVPELNPQTDDFGKSMLRFADGKRLGNNGAFWLAVHIANLFGIDKVSFEERVAWVQDNNEFIVDSAANPLDGYRFWCQADKPYCALAACFEWAGYQAEGEDFISYLPVAMDGSCSGLQHFSAMLNDREGAEAVNLANSPTPADIYTQVQARTEELLVELTDNLAYSWRNNVTRKIVKRPCMTFAYSVTSRGIRDQILDEMQKLGGGYLPGWENWEAASFLAPIVEQAIRDTVKRAAEAMDWLKDSVRVLLEAKRPVTWSTPLGFVVQQRYQRTTAKRFNVWFQGRRLRMNIRIDQNVADGRKQASAVAPNFVHSMDACHLQMVVNRMVDEEITTSFAVIHDSFGVHACDIDELHFAIRDEFIKLYSVSQLEKFRMWVLAALPEDKRDGVPPVPTEGDFKIEEVRDAQFFFA